MAILKQVSLLVLCLAITIGIIGKTKPELFLKLPMGFIPWAMTGNIMPPYFDLSPFGEEEFGTWTRDGDTFISTGAKSGTNWMLYCSHQIRTKAQKDPVTDYRDILLETPWVTMIHKPGQKWADIKEMMNTTVLADGTKVKDYWDNPSHPFRIFKAHEAPPTMPVKKYPKVKFVAMSRNGMDVINSFYPFFSSHNPAFKATWGGFPPTYPDPMSCLKDFLPGGTLAHLYFGYVKAWWPLRNEPNVLLLHYDDAKKDLAGTVTKLAVFLGVKLSTSEHAEVTNRCGIKHMKTIAHKFDYMQWAHDASYIMCGKTHCPGVDGSLVRSGVSGGGKTFFTAEMKALWDAAVQAELGSDPALLKWAAQGGPQ